MKLNEVQSSNIRRIGWDSEGLVVEYLAGTQYRYKKVPKEIYEQFLSAESKGRFMNEFIKNKYEYTKLEEKLN